MTRHFPDAAMKASRDSVHALPLELVDGTTLPDGLYGHLFILSPVGSVDSNGAPYPDGNDRPTLVNGDGMVWRIDLAPPGGGTPQANAEIVKPPDYHWDELTKNGTPLEFAGFMDVGMLRASLFLGTRNFANTAFVPLPPPAGVSGPTRMVCCYDAGPPVEIDPATLETLSVVGESWDPEALDGLVAFPPILATAHPFYDPETGELFAVNFGRTGLSLIETMPALEALAFLPDVAKNALGRLAAALGRAPVPKSVSGAVRRATQAAFGGHRPHKPAPPKIGALPTEPREESALPESFLDLVWWNGAGDIKRLNVIDAATGKGVAVEESMHQVALTKRFVLLLDTNFKLRLDQFYDNPLSEIPEVERLLRAVLASQQGNASNLWVIERDEVTRALAEGLTRVSAWRVILPGSVHFLADFEDRDGIRIQCAHGTSQDIAEWVRKDDLQLDGTPVRAPMHGLIASPVDVSRLGQYLIAPERRRIEASQVLSDDRLWGVALYAGMGIPAWGEVPRKMAHTFWFSTGIWPDNYTLFIRSLYAQYPDRLIPLEEVDRIVRDGGMPAALVCVEQDGFSIADSYTFPLDLVLSSPQFIPRPDARHDRDGWVSAVVWSKTEAFIWLFDAADLGRGPVTKLRVPATLGFSLHTAWLPALASTAGVAAVASDWRSRLEARIDRLSAKAKKRLAPLRDALRSR